MVTPTCGHFTVQLPNLDKISYQPCEYKGIMMHSLVTVQYQQVHLMQGSHSWSSKLGNRVK